MFTKSTIIKLKIQIPKYLRKTTGTRYAQILEVCHKKQLMLLFYFGQPTPNAWLQLDTYNKYLGKHFLKLQTFVNK